MKVRVTIDITDEWAKGDISVSLDSIDYEVKYENVESPGSSIDLVPILRILSRVFVDHRARALDETDK